MISQVIVADSVDENEFLDSFRIVESERRRRQLRRTSFRRMSLFRSRGDS
jgi:hypothetical protein